MPPFHLTLTGAPQGRPPQTEVYSQAPGTRSRSWGVPASHHVSMEPGRARGSHLMPVWLDLAKQTFPAWVSAGSGSRQCTQGSRGEGAGPPQGGSAMVAAGARPGGVGTVWLWKHTRGQALRNAHSPSSVHSKGRWRPWTQRRAFPLCSSFTHPSLCLSIYPTINHSGFQHVLGLGSCRWSTWVPALRSPSTGRGTWDSETRTTSPSIIGPWQLSGVLGAPGGLPGGGGRGDLDI